VGVALSEGDYCNATLSLKKGGLIGGWSVVGVALFVQDNFRGVTKQCLD